MKVLFIFPRPAAYNSESVREKPCGGTEKAVIFLGEALSQRGHEVRTITHAEETVDTDWPDIVITQEAFRFPRYPKAKKIWWTHHFPDQPVIIANSGYGRAFADATVTLSGCHSENFSRLLRIPNIVIPHGVWTGELETGVSKQPDRYIYASTPFRGLSVIARDWPAIKRKKPAATIAICSSMGTYGTPEEDSQFADLFEKLSRLDGVELKGALNQYELYKEYAKASIFWYPSIWAETYCIAMDEAIAHGCELVVSKLGALPERILPDGKGKPPLDWSEVAILWEALF